MRRTFQLTVELPDNEGSPFKNWWEQLPEFQKILDEALKDYEPVLAEMPLSGLKEVGRKIFLEDGKLPRNLFVDETRFKFPNIIELPEDGTLPINRDATVVPGSALPSPLQEFNKLTPGERKQLEDTTGEEY